MHVKSGRISGKLFVSRVRRARMNPTPSVPRRSNQLKPCLDRGVWLEYTLLLKKLRCLHSIYRLQHLLRSCLKGQDRIWRIVQFFDLFRVGNEDVSVIRSGEFERLPLCFVERVLDHLWAPEKECPCLITSDQWVEKILYNLCHTRLSLWLEHVRS
jgi:hypothetical protein